MGAMRLTPTSFILLGLVRWSPGLSAYEIEQRVSATVADIWTVQRSQIYKEPARLAGAGLLSTAEDHSGRVAKLRYTITEAGGQALDEWLATRVQQAHVVRDLAMLKIFFGADPVDLAGDQLTAHRQRLHGYEVLRAAGGPAPSGPRLALEAAIAHEQTSIEYWTKLTSPE